MKVDNLVLMFAGLFVFVSVLLGFFYSGYWFFFTVFVGLNLFQYSFSGFCPLRIFLKKFGAKE